jgi:hypothetical protein
MSTMSIKMMSHSMSIKMMSIKIISHSIDDLQLPAMQTWWRPLNLAALLITKRSTVSYNVFTDDSRCVQSFE